MSLLDISPVTMPDPFRLGARLPETFTTQNSRYDIREHALRDSGNGAWMVTITCIVGTFAGLSWTADMADVEMRPDGLVLSDGAWGPTQMRTTAVTTVNGYPVSHWGY